MPNSKSWFLPLAAVFIVSQSLCAQAGVSDAVAGVTDTMAGVTDTVAQFLGFGPKTPVEDIPAPTADGPVMVRAPGTISETVNIADFTTPSLPSASVAQLPEPSVETPLKKLFCAEYARAISGLNIFGDAKYWWERAKNLYARVSMPAPHTVMVFKPSARIKKGHVAVVTAIVSKREIRVEQANWQNHGEIDHATPILDVSARNDWSQVRVWDMRSKSFGGHVYAVSGFIAKDLVRQASRD